MPKQLQSIFIILCIILSQFQVQANEQDTNKQATFKLLWEQVEIDTFPYLKSYEATTKLALSSSFLWLIGRDKDSIGHALAMMQAYYYNVLGENMNIADTIAMVAEDKYPWINTNLTGHYGLRNYVPCFNIPGERCDELRKRALAHFDTAAVYSSLMPKEQWQWLANSLRNSYAFPSSSDSLNPIDIGLKTKFSSAWEGGILRIERKKGVQALLISDGARYPIQLLELQTDSTWKDVTQESGLDSLPGGHLLYAVDYNADGHEDFMVLRKSSVGKSPAKYFPSLLKNNGDGTYTDISKEAGLLDIDRGNCACWADINNDGKQDVFIGSEFSPSSWLVQDSTGKFVNKAFSYGIQTNIEIVKDCALLDLNGDKKLDLYLSLHDGKNRAYLQTKVGEEYLFFYEKADSLGMVNPKQSRGVLVSDIDEDGKQDLIVQSDFQDKAFVLAEVMNGVKADDTEESKAYLSSGTAMDIAQATGMFRTGAIIQYPGEHQWIAGGGKATEALFPIFDYRIGKEKDSLMVTTADYWSAYPHSTTTYIDSSGLPILLYRGGGVHPFMRGHVQGFQLQLSKPGKFVRLFNYADVQPGNAISYEIITAGSDTTLLHRQVQAKDSRGFYALQEWAFVPEGNSLGMVFVNGVSIHAPKQKKKGKKKK